MKLIKKSENEFVLIDKNGQQVDFQLDIKHIKNLLGEVDEIEKIVNNDNYTQSFKVGFEHGYNQALEDNKNNKWTDEDVIRIVEKSRETGLTAEYLMITFQPKTEWEVEFIDDELKLKQ